MNSANQGQSWKPELTPKFKLGAEENVEIDTISQMKTLFDKILENSNSPYEITKLAVTGLQICNEYNKRRPNHVRSSKF